MKNRSLATILANHAFFEGMEAHYLELLAGCAANVKFEAGASIFRQNDPADQFFLIREGKVSVEVSASNLDPLRIQTLHEGDVLGWSWLFPPFRWQFDARAVELTRALAMDGACLRGKCNEDHELGYALLIRFSSVVVERLKNTRMQLLDMYGAPATGK